METQDSSCHSFEERMLQLSEESREDPLIEIMMKSLEMLPQQEKEEIVENHIKISSEMKSFQEIFEELAILSASSSNAEEDDINYDEFSDDPEGDIHL